MAESTFRKNLDLSITLTPNDLQRLLDEKQLNNSSRLVRFHNNDEHSLADTVSAISRSNPLLKQKTDQLFTQFLEVLEGRTNDSDVFDTIQSLIHVCAGIFDETQKDVVRGVSTTNIRWLKEEMKTWKLLNALYKDRIMVQVDDDTLDCEMPTLGGSEKEVIAQLYTCNSTLREYQLAVDWLEACYDSRNELQIGHTIDRSVGWSNTLFQLNTQKVLPFGSSDLVKSLDPDAPIREKRQLHRLDAEDNLRLTKSVFEKIRQGRIDEAMSICKYSGQTWRAAILEGWRLHEDPNYSYEASNMKKPIEGNPRRDIWKKCAWMMSDSKKYDEYSRAITGAFCGHLESLKALLSSSWEDLLWSYLKVQIDIRVESEIRACCNKSYYQMPEAYWNNKMTLEQIFDELSVHKDSAVRKYAHSKIGIIQKFLILDNISELLLQMRSWIDSSAYSNADSDCDTTPLSAHQLRFLAHIVLFMRQIGRIDQEETADRIIAAYVECLIKLGDAQLVAFYTASLPGKLQVLLYSKFLENIRTSTARVTAFKEAINAGLDVECITRNTVESIRERLEPNDIEMGQEILPLSKISAFDQHKIKALEWLTFTPSQRAELLWQANALIRQYLAEDKAECVRAVFASVPADSLTHIMNIYGSLENMPYREDCSIKEYISYKVYLTALDSFDEWMHVFHNRPKQPAPLGTDANFTERIAGEHKEQTYRAELNRWNVSLVDQTQFTRDALYNVLVMPENGWLVDHDNDKEIVGVSETKWESRQTQLEKLRSICIPDIVMLLYKVLNLSGDYKACVELGNEIAAEKNQLYKVYTKHKMAELIAKLTEASLELLNQKVDPWGYPATM